MRRPFDFEAIGDVAGRALAAPQAKAAPGGLMSVSSQGGWWPIIRESFTGAWQRSITVDTSTVLSNPTQFACVTRIADDIGKIGLRLVERDSHGIWMPKNVPAFSPVLTKPNRYQNRIQFINQWVISKLINGNTYVLKVRDGSGIVRAMYVLNPWRVTPLVAPDGGVYYRLQTDVLSGLDGIVEVPASEIIHDRWNCLYHPLVGVSPIYACGVAAVQGLNIQNNSARFFGNGSRPSGVLTAPGAISQDTAERLKTAWETNYGGENYGKTAVLGDGLSYVPMIINAVDSQLIEQLKWTGETICGCYHVPAYMVGVGPAPSYNNIGALNQQYYTQCLQGHIEAIELCLDEGLGLTEVPGKTYGVEFDIDDLLRMDMATLLDTLTKGIKGVFSPNEARARMNLPPKAGGDSVYLQQQEFSLEALAKRDAQEDPFARATSQLPPADVVAGPTPPAAAANDKGYELPDEDKVIITDLELRRAIKALPNAPMLMIPDMREAS